MAEREVNPQSVNFILGEIKQRLENGDRIMQSLSVEVERLSEAISCLPCVSHDERLKAVEEDKTRRYSFSDAMKVTLAGAIFSSVLTAGATVAIFMAVGV